MSTMATARGHQHHSIHASDMDVLDAVTSMPLQLGHGSGHDHLSRLDPPPRKRHLDTLHALRRPPIDPIVLAASLSSGPHVTRHHFLHSFGPKVESKQMSRSEREKARQEETERENKSPRPGQRHRAGSYANCDGESSTQTSVQRGEVPQIKYESRQAPRSERLRRQQEAQAAADKVKAQKAKDEALAQQARLPSTSQAERPEFSRLPSAQVDRALNERKEILQAREGQSASLESASNTALQSATTNVDIPARPALSSIVRPPPIQIRCYARTRIPTPHGEIFCHLYRNNRDAKEHLALVVDTAQNAWGGEWESGEQSQETLSRQIRSRTLDEVWGPHETEMERIVRGAYVGRLGPNHQVASKPASIPRNGSQTTDAQAPLVRIHSECYTGETIGSQRCDCGEQLDEAIRLIHSDSQPAKGVVVYLRQEGRGIGLLDKLMAYNLQDMGHDTVSANILLGHLADARKYDVAAEILRDLGLSSCRLLTNNPEKMEALESEGINVQSRVPMVPRVWRHGLKHDRSSRRKKSKQKIRGLEDSIVSQFDHHRIHTNAGTPALEEGDYSDDGSDGSRDSYVDHVLRRSGATMVGSSITRGPELEKYLRTKVERMGHLLDLPQDHSVRSESDAGAPLTDEETPLNEKNLALHDAHAAEVREDDDEDDDEDHILIDA